jgi:hypothetical protein
MNMCSHRNNAISNNIIRLVYNVTRNLLELVDDALQHLKIQQTNRQVIIYIKKIQTNRSFVVWFPQQSLLFQNWKIHFTKNN